jgi:hypothetical protein
MVQLLQNGDLTLEKFEDLPALKPIEAQFLDYNRLIAGFGDRLGGHHLGSRMQPALHPVTAEAA